MIKLVNKQGDKGMYRPMSQILFDARTCWPVGRHILMCAAWLQKRYHKLDVTSLW